MSSAVKTKPRREESIQQATNREIKRIRQSSAISLKKRVERYQDEDDVMIRKTRADDVAYDTETSYDYSGLRDTMGSIRYCLYMTNCGCLIGRHMNNVAKSFESKRLAQMYEKNTSLLSVRMKARSDDLSRCEAYMNRCRAEYNREKQAGRLDAAAKHANELQVLMATKRTLQGLMNNLQASYADNQHMYLAMDKLAHKADYEGDREIMKNAIGSQVMERGSKKAAMERENFKFDYQLGKQLESGVESAVVMSMEPHIDEEVMKFLQADTVTVPAMTDEGDLDDVPLDEVPLIGSDDV